MATSTDCLRLLDRFGDFVLGEFQGIAGSLLLGRAPGKSLLGDIDLQGNLFLELGQPRFLPFQLRFGQFQFASRLLHLVAVVDRFDLRQYLPLLDLVILFDKEAHDASRNHLGSNIDDVGLHKGIIGDGMGETVDEPVNAEVRRRDRRHYGDTPDDPSQPRGTGLERRGGVPAELSNWQEQGAELAGRLLS